MNSGVNNYPIRRRMAGELIHYAGSIPPSGYLVCNGQKVSRATYAALFSAIGTTYGKGDGATTFALPDTRGYFLRSLDQGQGLDPGRALGSGQGEAMADHRHNLMVNMQGPFWANDGGGPGGSCGRYAEYPVMGNEYWAGQPMRPYANTQNNWVNFDDTVTNLDENRGESRPVNIAFLVCIAY